MTRLERLAPWAVAAIVAAMAAWGLDARDLAGDEVHMLVGDPLWITGRALDPRGGFVGHLPWSYWLRWVALTLGGDAAWVWRIHALIGAALAAGLGTRIASLRLGIGGGVATGLLIGLSPVLAFHAQDSSNYAWSAVTGVLVLGGLWGLYEERRGAAWWLGSGLLIGGLNDVYFVFIGLVCVAASLRMVLRKPTSRADIAKAWAPSILILLPAAVLFASRLLQSHAGGVVDVHADPPAPSDLPWALDVCWRVVRRFFCSMQAGYEAGRIDARWEAVAPVLTGVAALAAAIRGRARVPAFVLGAALLLVLCAGIGFRAWTGRTLPHEPRAFLTLLPALACVLVAGLSRLPHILKATAFLLLAIGMGSPLIRQMSTPSTMHRDAARLAAAAGPWLTQAGLAARDLHVVVPDERIRARLPAVVAPMGPGTRASQHDCIPDTDGVLVLVRNQPLDGPTTRPGCQGASTDLTRHTLIATASMGPPSHERNAASFLMPVQVEVWWPSSAAIDLPDRQTFRLQKALLDGTAHDTRVTVWTSATGPGQAERIAWEGQLGTGIPPVGLHDLDAQARIVLTPPTQDIPDTALLDPLRRQFQSTEPRQVAPLALGDSVSALEPMRAPAWQVLLRVIRMLLALLTGMAAIWPGRRA